MMIGGDRQQVGQGEPLVQGHRGAEGEARVGMAQRVADRLQPGRDRAGAGYELPQRVGHLAERQDRRDRQGGVRVDPGGDAGQSLAARMCSSGCRRVRKTRSPGGAMMITAKVRLSPTKMA